MATQNEHLRQLIERLPDTPGVYQFFNAEAHILYIGKAKNLKRRVSSYFNKNHDNNRITMLVRQICDIRTVLVETEYDALLLENNLIKKYQPRYNVNLKDDKTYPWIVIRKEHYPRVHYTRRHIRDGSTYFGPYASPVMISTVLELINGLYKLRTCTLALTPDNIAKKKFRVCLEYHVGNCLGPCEGRQTEEEYDLSIAGIRDILKGNINTVIRHVEERMNAHAATYAFEEAQRCKEMLDQLQRYKGRSVIVHPTIHNVDVFSFVQEGQAAFVNFVHVVNGAIIHSFTIELRKKLDESPEELLGIAIAELRQRYNSNAPELIVPFIPELEVPGATLTVPRIGDKKKLLDLSEKNVRYFMKEKLDQADKLNPEHRVERLLERMKTDLRLTELPYHIECFDNSNFQGDHAVSAMSVFRNGRPSKREYRHFNIKTVQGPDDFASMEEVIYRRYKRVLEEHQPLPQLIVIDGGKGQLSAALNSLDKLGLRGKVGIIGIAKRLEEIYYPGDSLPLYLDKKGETLKILQHLRDEVHRFGITHHRKRRSKALVKTELSDIKGIGEATASELLRHFRSVKRIRESSLEDLAEVVGQAKAGLVHAYFLQAGTQDEP
ncbi:MAG: excinuclease ABC subunit UvrC [Sphingobacteriales bacterium]|nr:excinuclease ABC subunit UvrC [Sphingobacteriales bacterium]